MAEVKCGNKQCGKIFEARTADVRRGWGKFCSKSCAKSGNRSAQRPVGHRATIHPTPPSGGCRECGFSKGLIGVDGLCDLCAFLNESLMGWDDHK